MWGIGQMSPEKSQCLQSVLNTMQWLGLNSLSYPSHNFKSLVSLPIN